MPSSRRLCLTSSSFELKRYARRRSEKPFLLRTLNLSLSMSSSLRSSSSISSSTISLIWSRNHGSILDQIKEIVELEMELDDRRLEDIDKERFKVLKRRSEGHTSELQSRLH